MEFENKEVPISKVAWENMRRIGLRSNDSELNKIYMYNSPENFQILDSISSKYGSVENLKDQAFSGQDCEAQTFLSWLYQEGVPELGIEQDFERAIDLLESARKNGDKSAIALLDLATLHDRKGTIPHQRRAHELYLQAAKLGEVTAELNLAESYRCGVDGVVNKDLEVAFKWYRQAAGEVELRAIDSQSISHPTCHMMGNTRKMAIDSQFIALKCLHKYYMVGDCPEGKPQPIKALYYLKKAAELGDPEAQKDLGLAYLTGESGYPKDLDQAKRWLGKAAKNGEQEAEEVLEKFGPENIDFESGTGQPDAVGATREYMDILRIEMAQKKHPYFIQNPMLFQESMFTQFPDSPTAQHYLKAFKLVKKGLEKIQESRFKDPEGISLLAQGYLYENTIIQSFFQLKDPKYRCSLFIWIDEILESNPNFFEGLLLMSALHHSFSKVNFESCKLDLRKTMCLNNLIHLIKKAEPDKPPKEDPYNFEEDYSSWLHVLHYFLGSNYIITGCFKDGAQAFDMALKCCPNYFEAKLPLGHCLMNLWLTKHESEYEANPTEKLLETFAIPKNQRILKGDYLSWSQNQLRQKAKQLFMEYVQEAPECDKKYSDGYYHLAVLYMKEGNYEQAEKWREKGEDSEEKRLPFLEPLNLSSKKLLATLDVMPSSLKKKTRCSNKKCRNKRISKFTLQPCPCRKVFYCGRGCQEEDWREHKKTCSAKKKRK